MDNNNNNNNNNSFACRLRVPYVSMLKKPEMRKIVLDKLGWRTKKV